MTCFTWSGRPSASVESTARPVGASGSARDIAPSPGVRARSTASITATASFPFTSAATITGAITITATITTTFTSQVLIVRANPTLSMGPSIEGRALR